MVLVRCLFGDSGTIPSPIQRFGRTAPCFVDPVIDREAVIRGRILALVDYLNRIQEITSEPPRLLVWRRVPLQGLVADKSHERKIWDFRTPVMEYYRRLAILLTIA